MSESLYDVLLPSLWVLWLLEILLKIRPFFLLSHSSVQYFAAETSFGVPALSSGPDHSHTKR